MLSGARAPVAEIAVMDDALGSAVLGLAGANAGLFEIDGATLLLRVGTVPDASAMGALSVDVTVSDPALGPGPAGSATFAAPVLDTTRAGTDGADLQEGGAAAHIPPGLGGDDRLAGGPGDDLLDGGPGRDTALFEGAPPGFTTTFDPGGVVVAERAPGGADRRGQLDAGP